MGTIFEELGRRPNQENDEEAGQHWTPGDAVKLMAKGGLPAGIDEQSAHQTRESKQLRRRRSELCERIFAHVCNRGGMRRS